MPYLIHQNRRHISFFLQLHSLGNKLKFDSKANHSNKNFIKISRRLKNFLLKNFFGLGLWDWHRCRDHLFKRSSQPIKLQRWKQVTSTACLCCCGLYFQRPAFIDIKRSLCSLLKSFLFLTEITGTDCVEEGRRLIPWALSRSYSGPRLSAAHFQLFSPSPF